MVRVQGMHALQALHQAAVSRLRADEQERAQREAEDRATAEAALRRECDEEVAAARAEQEEQVRRGQARHLV